MREPMTVPTTTEEALTYYRDLTCCLTQKDRDQLDQVTQVTDFEYSVPNKEAGYAIAQLKSGAWAVFWEEQDYTGHGCQCDSGIITEMPTGHYTGPGCQCESGVIASFEMPTGRPFASRDEAIRFGLTQEGRRILHLELPEEK